MLTTTPCPNIEHLLADEKHIRLNLGLSIIKQLSMLMKGEISVDSSLTGTTFVVSFPLPQSEHSANVEHA